MAAQGGTDATSLKRLVTEQTGRFEFFQAVRLLHRIFAHRAPVGYASDPEREALRFRSSLDFGFPPTEIRRMDEGIGRRSVGPGESDGEADERPLEMTVAFMGVATPSSFGSLPLRYTEHIRDQERDGHGAIRDFLDLFNHRFISLFYRAWEKHNLPVSHERKERGKVEEVLYSLMGLGQGSLAGRLALPDRALLFRAGLLGRKPLTASCLERLIQSYFDAPAEVTPFMPRWHQLAEEDRTRLGGANTRLGDEAVLGDTVHLIQHGFRVKLGPLRWNLFKDLLPVGSGFSALVDLVRLAVGSELEFDIQLIQGAANVPELRLSSDPGENAYLGWSSWLKSRPFDHDPSDVIFDSRTVPPKRREA